MNSKDSVTVMDTTTETGRQSRRNEAVGIEIPVTVHASRTTQGLGKNLPAVHEDTRTVIVLPQGAVVRLTATLIPGETVVLTNHSTGADVLCRVGNIKSQPGIQHYVDLEFIQRAPSFWGPVALPEGHAGVSETPRRIPPAAPAPSVGPNVTLAHSAGVSGTTPVVTMPTPPSPPLAYASAIAEPAQIAPLAEDISSPDNGPAALHPVTVMRPVSMGRAKDADFSSFTQHSHHSSGTQKGLLTAAAAVALVFIGAAGGYWFYRQQNIAPASSVAQHTVNTPPAQQLPAAAQIPADTNTISVPPAPSPAQSMAMPQPHTDITIDSQPPKDVRAPEFPPLSRASERTAAPQVRRAVPIADMKTPKPKAHPVSAVSADPPPMVIATAANLADPGSALLLGGGSGPTPPASSLKPAVGGQLQPPRLVSSVQPVYPASAKAQRLQGVVTLDALIDEAGKVVQTTVITGPVGLQAAAQESLRNWRYQPAQLNGKPISVHTKVSVRFSLQ